MAGSPLLVPHLPHHHHLLHPRNHHREIPGIKHASFSFYNKEIKALCNPTQYRQRLLSWGQRKLFLLYLLPVILASLILNIPQAISVTNMGLMMESNKMYMDFLLFFQLFHPLLTSVSMSAFFLIWMNTKIYLRIKARRVRGVNRKVTRQMEVVQVQEKLFFHH